MPAVTEFESLDVSDAVFINPLGQTDARGLRRIKAALRNSNAALGLEPCDDLTEAASSILSLARHALYPIAPDTARALSVSLPNDHLYFLRENDPLLNT